MHFSTARFLQTSLSGPTKVSAIETTTTGEVREQYGHNPAGLLTYTADGRVMAHHHGWRTQAPVSFRQRWRTSRGESRGVRHGHFNARNRNGSMQDWPHPFTRSARQFARSRLRQLQRRFRKGRGVGSVEAPSVSSNLAKYNSENDFKRTLFVRRIPFS
ncbi:MAG: hypothetical protein DMG30_11405 [Acidobacteria bacterium]|nr:MAG: hypothetical protein DMG30_11405 [Acidobacteriota bacterium]